MFSSTQATSNTTLLRNNMGKRFIQEILTNPEMRFRKLNLYYSTGKIGTSVLVTKLDGVGWAKKCPDCIKS